MRESLVDLNWLESNFPCRAACPVGTEAGRYVALIEEGRYREAYAVARRPNPLASICGRICAAPCESACRRGAIDEPVSIRALKRFVTERFGVESMIDLEALEEIYGRRQRLYPDTPVAIIGAGPAGLAAAHDLALNGYPVTLFESQPVAGGMLRLGIPEYRLPRELIKLEINAILSLGVKLELGRKLGSDFSLADLRKRGFKAIFLGIGAHKGRGLQIEGASLDGIVNGVDFLLNVNMGYRLDLGRRVAVIGGGNVALDVARTALRSAIPDEYFKGNLNIVTALDVARSAVRFGVKEVHAFSLESMDEMPADREEIAQAGEEGVIFHPGRGPKRFTGLHGKLVEVVTVRCLSVFDDGGRFSPVFEEGSEESLPFDTVILAIGQQTDVSFLGESDEMETGPGGTIKVDPLTLQTTVSDLFSGGDAAFGPRLAINAVADGRRAAASIHRFLQGLPLDQREDEPTVSVEIRTLEDFSRVPDFEGIPRQQPPLLPIGRRVGIAEIEGCFSEEHARIEASRCLHCWVNTVFQEDPEQGTECILCGGCADVCPEACIEFISLKELQIPSDLGPLMESELGFDVPSERSQGVALVKDESFCIRCGLCARRCPSGTIRMEAFYVEESGNEAA